VNFFGRKKKPPGCPGGLVSSVRFFSLRARLSSAGAVREPKVGKEEAGKTHGPQCSTGLTGSVKRAVFDDLRCVMQVSEQ
jgi:hypothetical protein